MSPSRRLVSSFHPASILEQNYDFRGLLGQGQYGRVWKCEARHSSTAKHTAQQPQQGAEQPPQRPLFACKQILNPRLPTGELKPSVEREIEVMQRLQGHPNVVSLHSVYEHIGDPAADPASPGTPPSVFLLMDLMPAGDLFTQVSERSGLPESEARHVFAAVARAVKHCHDSGIVHRDLKPENILLRKLPLEKTEASSVPCGCLPFGSRDADAAHTGPWEVKLADFGLARELPPGAGAYITGCVGSYPYEAPEVLAHRPYDRSADVWSLGVLLYASLCSSWPEFKDGRRALDESRDWAAPVWSLVSEPAKRLIRRMLSVDPRQRPTMDEILSDTWLDESRCVDVLCPAECEAALERIAKRAESSNSGKAGAEFGAAAPVGAAPGTPAAVPHLLEALVTHSGPITAPPPADLSATSSSSSASFADACLSHTDSPRSNACMSFDSSASGSISAASSLSAGSSSSGNTDWEATPGCTAPGGPLSTLTTIALTRPLRGAAATDSSGKAWWQGAATAVMGLLFSSGGSSATLAADDVASGSVLRGKGNSFSLSSASTRGGGGSRRRGNAAARVVTHAPGAVRCSRGGVRLFEA